MTPFQIATDGLLGSPLQIALRGLLSGNNVLLAIGIPSEGVMGTPEFIFGQILQNVSAESGELFILRVGKANLTGGTGGVSTTDTYKEVMSKVYRITVKDEYDIRT